MKIKLNISIFLSVTMLCLCILISSYIGNDHKFTNGFTETAINDKTVYENEELRGLWVSFITLDMTNTDKSFESFKSKFDKIIEKALEYKMNSLFVQVRPFCDAIYESDIFPYSHILTGVQGEYPGYDALEYMCQEAHSNNLKIHAWINPYRVATSTTPNKLASKNPYVLNENIGLTTDSGIFLNPAKKASRNLIVEGVAEIVKNYPIDGIQFDDYFYPADIGNKDYADYNAYKKSTGNNNPLTIEQWRNQNVNMLISQVFATIKSINKNVAFGISPQGNIENNKSLFADIKSWSEVYGYLDYICPQMYYSIDNPTVKFETSLKEWKNFNYHANIKIYIGLGAYKAGTNTDNGTWLEKDNILSNELLLLRKYSYDGYILYDYSAFESENAQAELNNLLSVID